MWVWKYRNELAKSMWDININLDDDSLRKEELVKFWNKLIKFINNLPSKNRENKKELQTSDRLSTINSSLREYSWKSSMINNKTFNNLWEDILTANLRELWIIGWACFKTMKFREIMNQNNKF
jgi:flagellar biosynthesis/type III secretory pathway chaperone